MKLALPLLAGPLGVALTSVLVWTALPREPALATDDLILVPFAVDAVRVPGVSAAQVLIYEPRAALRPTRIHAVRLLSEGLLLHEELVDHELCGAADFGEVNALVERLPESVTELHRTRRWFAAPDAPEFSGLEVMLRGIEIAERVEDLSAAYASGAPRPFVELNLPLPLDQLFSGDEAPGSTRTVNFEVAFSGSDGLRATTAVSHTITWLGLARPPSPTLAGGAAAVYAGDLHVHSCHGEAVNACAPSGDCAAENFQIAGSFSYAQLKSQFQALGISWFSANDHSFCIDSSSEYTSVVAEIAAINDSDFFAFPDIELSSTEVGPQTGNDAANALCAFATPQNHMGAHGITSWKPGGSGQALGFCSGLDNFEANAAAIRAEGGWPIVHHPVSKSNGWNSHSATQGMLKGQMHGVEVWNGQTTSGEGGPISIWVQWLLVGRVLYAYSGSDTHDAAFAFGTNNVLLVGEPYTPANLRSALFGGRSYVSNQHSLQIELLLAGETLAMGTLHALPAGGPAQPATVNVHYDFGPDTSVIRVFEGRVGASAENLLCTSPPLTGSGVFTCPATAAGAISSWYRAQSTGNGLVAITNPVFLLAGKGNLTTYCTAKTNSQGCTPAISWNGLPSTSLESPFEVRATNVLSNKAGLLSYGFAPAATPFQGGLRCIAGPLRRTPFQGSGGNPLPIDCSGTYRFDFQNRIQKGVDPALAAGATIYCQFWSRDVLSPSPTGLTDAARFTILP